LCLSIDGDGTLLPGTGGPSEVGLDSRSPCGRCRKLSDAQAALWLRWAEGRMGGVSEPAHAKHFFYRAPWRA
jgi:hypothetical protein